MVIVELDRKHNRLRIGNSTKDIETRMGITTIYNVSHVTRYFGDWWYEIYRGKTLLGDITGVESVKEKW